MTRKTLGIAISAALAADYFNTSTVRRRDAADLGPANETRLYDFHVELDRASANNEARTIRASLSSEAPIQRFDGVEVLKHDPKAIDLSRAVAGLPLLFNHDRNRPLGRAHDFQFNEGKLDAELRFSNSSEGTEKWEQVRDGFLTDMSIGYRVRKWEVDEDTNTHTGVDWELLEASVVTVPADISVGVGRSMPTSSAPAAATRDDSETTVVNFQATRDTALREGREQGARVERERIEGIRGLFVRERFQSRGMLALRDDLIAQSVSVDVARERLLDAIGTGVEPVIDSRTDDQGRGRDDLGRASAGDDALDKFREAAEVAVAVKANVERDVAVIETLRQNEFSSYSITELARHYLHLGNVDTRGWTPDRLLGQAFVRSFMPGQGISDFANVLGTTAERALMIGWSASPETWAQWTRRGTLNDYRQAERVALSGFGALQEIPDSGEYKQVQISDLKEFIKLAKYGALFNISRGALLQDDLSALSAVPMEMGKAAARKVGDVVYAVLTSNPTLNQDATALFDVATHGNLVTSGAAPSVATYDTMVSTMKLQRAPSPNADDLGHRVGVGPAFVLAPVALESTVVALSNNEFDPQATAGTMKKNPHTRITPITDHRLDDSDPATWYGVADPAQGETIEVSFLNGNAEPQVESENGWTIDGVSNKVRVEAAAAALDYRFMFRNDGN